MKIEDKLGVFVSGSTRTNVPSSYSLPPRLLPNLATAVPPDWLWSVFSGGYKHMGTEITLGNTHLHKKGVVKGEGGCRQTTFFLEQACRSTIFLCGAFKQYGLFFRRSRNQSEKSSTRIILAKMWPSETSPAGMAQIHIMDKKMCHNVGYNLGWPTHD